MVAFLTSVAVTAVMIGVILYVAKRRPPGTPLTWGEGFLAGTFMFALMLMLYGIVPNQWLAWADTELGWRSDSIGVPTPWGRLWENGVTFFGRGRIMVTALVIRDIIATTIYVVAFVGQIVGWLWWQKRGKRTAPPPAIETSAFGRPLVRKV
jgi:hypothetical protein